jgi:hypothetical protein
MNSSFEGTDSPSSADSTKALYATSAVKRKE